MSMKGFTHAGNLPRLVAVLGAVWSRRWHTEAVKHAGVYSYRDALFGVDTERAA
jgi:hypothetical protein